MAAYKVDGMTCDGCARAVERAVRAALPGAEVRVDRPTGRIDVEAVSPVDEAVLARALDDAGFVLRGRA